MTKLTYSIEQLHTTYNEYYKISVSLNKVKLNEFNCNFHQDVYDERTGLEIIQNLKNNIKYANGIDFSNSQRNAEFYIRRTSFKDFNDIIFDIKLITNNCLELPSSFEILQYKI